MLTIIIVLFVIILLIVFIQHNNHLNECFGGFEDPIRHTKNMSYDLRGDIPPTQTFTGPWLQSDIYNPVYINYYRHQPWLDHTSYNIDDGNQFVRANGTPLFM